MPSEPLNPTQLATLQQQATEAAQNAYAPYSHFRVGAAILFTNGETVTGCNVENASYRLTTCAEQNAIAAAVSRYGPDLRIAAVVVTTLNDVACAPCGACRQTIQEFATPTTLIYFPGPNQTTTHLTIAELLPAAFLAESFLP